MRFAVGVEYDGRHFSGWEIQPRRNTVQGCLEEALSCVADAPIRTTCAGRTDSGVHGVGQVAHFDTQAPRPEQAWVHGANTHLPPSICVTWAKQVTQGFHARYSAEKRQYRYLILNRAIRPAVLEGRVGWEYRRLDAQCMHDAGQYLLGEQDFSSFRAAGCQSRTANRRIYRLSVERAGDLITIDVVANAFLQHMVRNIVGALCHVGAGKEAPAWVEWLMRARDRRLGTVTVPPDGLYLLRVEYPSKFDIPRVSSVPWLC